MSSRARSLSFLKVSLPSFALVGCGEQLGVNNNEEVTTPESAKFAESWAAQDNP